MTRYILEVKNKKADERLAVFMQEVGASQIDYIDSYEPLERITKEVEKVGNALREYKKSGVSMDIMKTYLKGKGHSLSTINDLMGDVNEFLKKIGLLN
jgi:hypothetical protein